MGLGAATGHVLTPAPKDEICGHRCCGPHQLVHPMTRSPPGRSAVPDGKLSHGKAMRPGSAHGGEPVAEPPRGPALPAGCAGAR